MVFKDTLQKKAVNEITIFQNNTNRSEPPLWWIEERLVLIKNLSDHFLPAYPKLANDSASLAILNLRKAVAYG